MISRTGVAGRGAPADVQDMRSAGWPALPAHGSDAELVVRELLEGLRAEGDPRRNLGTFTTTGVSDRMRELMDHCLDRNLINRHQYPTVSDAERQCLEHLAALWHLPGPNAGAVPGCSTSGSSEAAMLAGLALKRRWQATAPAGRIPNLALGAHSHVCWLKFCAYFDVEPRLVPLDADGLRLDPEAVAAACDRDTIGVIAVLGSTELGLYDPVAEIAAVLDRLHRDHGVDVPLHVDAASGGFVAPFLSPETQWDFRLPRVRSINASGHKYGGVPPTVGWLLWRPEQTHTAELGFQVTYTGGTVDTLGLTFSRPGAQVVAQYYTFLTLGFTGYRDRLLACAAGARRLARELATLGHFRVLGDGTDLPVITFTLRPGHSWTLDDLSDRLAAAGWQVPAYQLPDERTTVMRFVVRADHDGDLITAFLADLHQVTDHLTADKDTPAMTPAPLRIASTLRSHTPPAPGTGLRIALYQGQGPVGTPEAVETNLARMAEVVERAAAYRAQVCVFPEKFNTGYAITEQQCRQLAEPRHGASIQAAQHAAKEHHVAIVLPYPEIDVTTDPPTYYDAIAVITADGDLAANYRKTHLYGAAERRRYAFGNTLPPVVDINGFPVGILNCYECEMPPLYQYLAEQGARVIIGPTAADYHFTLADGTPSLVPYQDATRHIIPAMASVWKLFVAYCNRRGWETVPDGSWQYRGNSGIWAPNGEPVITAGDDEQHADTLLIADCLPDAHPAFSPEGNHLTDNRLKLHPHLRPGT